MLKRLKIDNYALIDSIEISFDKGMTSITGETGAGKSIILGGLSMVLGSRIDNSKIINKNKKHIFIRFFNNFKQGINRVLVQVFNIINQYKSSHIIKCRFISISDHFSNLSNINIFFVS